MGLTGGVASGKSRVGQLLARRGAAVLDADRVVADLYRPGREGAAAVLREFGPKCLAADGGVDRAALGALVLADPAARRRLEAAVHPLVRAEVARWLAAQLAAARAVAVVEAALLVETGSWRTYHRLVVVEAPLHLRRQRALAAGWREEAFAAVVAAQAGEAERRAVAHYLLRNDGDAAQLEAQVERLWEALCADAQRLAAGLPLSRGLTEVR